MPNFNTNEMKIAIARVEKTAINNHVHLSKESLEKLHDALLFCIERNYDWAMIVACPGHFVHDLDFKKCLGRPLEQHGTFTTNLNDVFVFKTTAGNVITTKICGGSAMFGTKRIVARAAKRKHAEINSPAAASTIAPAARKHKITRFDDADAPSEVSKTPPNTNDEGVNGPVVQPTDETHTRCFTNGYLRIQRDRGRCNGIGMISSRSLNKSSLFRYFKLCAV